MTSRALPAAALLVSIPLLTGCQAFGINEQYDARYPTLAAAQESWDAAQLPRLLPEDAASIRLGYNTIEKGAMLAFASPGGLTADYCAADEVDGGPAFEPAWWPQEALPTDGYTCGDWSVVVVDDEFYVWN